MAMSQVSISAVAPRVTLDTYRALRLGMVAAGLLLLVSVVLECLRIGGIPGSISATFYSPVRSVFVATLLTVGLALVAIKGRPGWENGLLDIAGLLVPLVAFVPTPVTLASIADGATLRYTCPERGEACVPPELAPDVANNAAAYLIVLGVGIVFVWARWWRARSSSQAWHGRTTRALVVATVLAAVIAAWFLLARDSFTNYAHYTSAITFFVLLIAVVWINGRHVTTGSDLLGMSSDAYRRAYYGIALAMTAAVLAGVITFAITGEQSGFPVVFWLEVALLLLFITFWLLQTSEHWNHGQPPVAV
mgnify:CR=1 FL=1